jgi:hypothetical protein
MLETFTIPQIALLQARSGDPGGALTSFRQMLDSWRGTAELLLLSHGIGGLIVLFERLGRYPPSAILHGMLRRMFPTNPFVDDLAATVHRVRESLGSAEFEALQERGAAMPVQHLTEYAQEQIRGALEALDQPSHRLPRAH